MADTNTLARRAREAGDRAGFMRLLEDLGFALDGEAVPRAAWRAWGIEPGGDVAALVVAGSAGTLTALLVELATAPRVETFVAVAGRIRRRNPARLHLFAFAGPGYRSLALGTFAAAADFRFLSFERERLRASDLDALAEMVAGPGEEGLELALRHARALDRSRITRRFFDRFRAQRNALAGAWTGIPAEAARERADLSLLLLSRLTFLYFLQRKGVLAGDDRYLPRLFGAWSDAPVPGATFYRARLVPLFFGVLNRRPAERDREAAALGPLPYLNGGLFEPHAHERRFPALDLPDAEVRSILDDLLERYRFTVREAGAGAGFGVDPEVLGRVFEGLMEPVHRGETGSYYTPAPVVHRMVREALGEYVTTRVPGVDPDALLDGRAEAVDPARRYRARHALERVRVLDPACGSGAFLLGALHCLARALGAVSDAPPPGIRHGIVARSLHGVDLLDDAALLCSLRLWLALAAEDDEVRPLPNLDRRIRQGDALVDPLDLAAADLPGHRATGNGAAGNGAVMADPELRRALHAVPPAARRYLDSEPEERATARAGLALAETALARHWVRALSDRQRAWLRSCRAAAGDRDLFGDIPRSARAAEAAGRLAEERLIELDAVARELEESGSLPFFSFGVHFAAAERGFDVVVSNPPWVRAHRWPRRLRSLAARRFEVCREAGWAGAARLTGVPAAAGSQVDLSLLFVERAIQLLAPGGVLAVLVPAKALRALYGGAVRRILLRDLEFALIEDHALDPGAMFRADTFPAVIVARRPTREVVRGWADGPTEDGAGAPAGDGAGESPGGRVGAPRGGGACVPATSDRPIRIRLGRRGAAPLAFTVRAAELPLFADDPASPWLLAPPDAVAAFRAMQAAGPPLGESGWGRVHRGVMTGANDVLVFSRVEPRLGGLAHVEAEGYRRARRTGRGAGAASRFRGYVETAAVRPLVRGSGIDAFTYRTSSYIAWCHGPDSAPTEPPPRLVRYLARHRAALESRPGWRPGLPLGAVFRLSPASLGPKIAWHDLSDTLRAVALPATVPFDGAQRELVPLNTVYFIPAPEPGTGEALAGLLNSLPVRTFARAIAERAKDARFRFFAWTIACLPLPRGWAATAAGREIGRISARAHARGGVEQAEQAALDRAAAAVYGLGPEAVEALERFDRWLRGET